MVAVSSAIQAPDAALASELGSLLVAHTQIRDPRWRLAAIVRRVPALVRFGVPLDATRAAIRELAAKAPCPPSLRPLIIDQLVATLEVGYVRALWTPDWRGSVQLAVDAAVRTGALRSQERIIERFVDSATRYAKPRIVRAKTLVDLIALVDEGRADEAERVARGLRAGDQPFAKAHLARLDLRAGRTPRRVKGSIASGGQLLLVREALAMGDIDRAGAMAAQIERTLLREYALVEIAKAMFERGRVVDALRLLYSVKRAELCEERDRTRDEIRLITRRDRELCSSAEESTWELPGWLRPRGWLRGSERRQRWLAVVFIRQGLRGERSTMGLAKDYVRRVRPSSLLDVLPPAGVDVDKALAMLRLPSILWKETPRERDGVDALIAEHVARRADALARSTRELPEAMRLGLAGVAMWREARPRQHVDGNAIERLWFDEGVALSSSGSRRRRVLIEVARACIRSSRSQSRDVLQTRLRTLVHVGGSLAADAIAIPLASEPIRAERFMELLAVLGAIDAERAGTIVLDRFCDLAPNGVDPILALDHVVAMDGIDANHAYELAKTYRWVRDALGTKADAWFAELSRRWLARTGARLDRVALAWLRTCELQDPQVMLDQLDDIHASLLVGDARSLAKRLSTDEAALRVVLLASPRVDASIPAWSIAQWQSFLADAALETPAVNLSVVRRCARLLQRPRMTPALATGDLSALGVIRSVALAANGKSYRLHLLDRRRDLLTFLRFADVPASSCFRSDSSYYSDDDTFTQREVLAAWRDPLTICFHIERDLGNSFAPCGFLFGSFADVDGEPAVLFNSLHVRPSCDELRVQVLRSVERSLAALRLRYIAIANTHGGKGHLPDDYVSADREVIRLRALSQNNGEPETFIDDDVSYWVNQRWFVFDLYWRTLER